MSQGACRVHRTTRTNITWDVLLYIQDDAELGATVSKDSPVVIKSVQSGGIVPSANEFGRICRGGMQPGDVADKASDIALTGEAQLRQIAAKCLTDKEVVLWLRLRRPFNQRSKNK